MSLPAAEPPAELALRRRDYALLAVFCFLLFGHTLVIGRVLTMHEGILPQSAREMFADHDWVSPKNGGRVWLEKPPLPQWITVGVASLFGRCDAEWIVRIPPILMGTCVVLLAAWMGGRWFGRTIGLLTGLVLATMAHIVRYSTLAEADIFLCAVVAASMALFVRVEFRFPSPPGGERGGAGPPEDVRFFGTRSWAMLSFFVVLGMTNLAKGLIFGTAMVVIPIGGYLLWNANLQGIRRYCWFWGWLAYLGVSLAWPLAAYARYPDVLELWRTDYQGRLSDGYIYAPRYYYALALPWIMLPWTIPALIGLWQTRREAVGQGGSPQRLMWCWALLTPLVFSIPDGKHHHYLIHCLAPWAILGAMGAVWLWQRVPSWPALFRDPRWALVSIALPVEVAILVFRDKIPGPNWAVPALLAGWPLVVFLAIWSMAQRNGRLAAGGVFSLVAVLYCVGYGYRAHYLDRYRDDTAFMREVAAAAPADEPIYFNAELDTMEAFRFLFYLGDRAVVLHNATFLLDERIRQSEVLVIARERDEYKLERYGEAEAVLESRFTRMQGNGGRWTLFRLRFREGLERKSANVRISPVQAIEREFGPYLD